MFYEDVGANNRFPAGQGSKTSFHSVMHDRETCAFFRAILRRARLRFGGQELKGGRKTERLHSHQSIMNTEIVVVHTKRSHALFLSLVDIERLLVVCPWPDNLQLSEQVAPDLISGVRHV
eukprot:223755-Hanusia_phi.AAC.1